MQSVADGNVVIWHTTVVQLYVMKPRKLKFSETEDLV